MQHDKVLSRLEIAEKLLDEGRIEDANAILEDVESKFSEQELQQGSQISDQQQTNVSTKPQTDSISSNLKNHASSVMSNSTTSDANSQNPVNAAQKAENNAAKHDSELSQLDDDLLPAPTGIILLANHVLCLYHHLSLQICLRKCLKM